ncbi:MAG TPA: ABC transporter permease [Euzebya sp.]|nr:ABC transporter permease [Euzebya sp.]
MLHARELPVVILLVVVTIATGMVNPRFLGPQSLRDLLLAVSFIALMAIGQTFVILMRQIDLSVGSTLGLASYVTAVTVQRIEGPSVLLLLLAGAGVGLAVGLANGLLVSWLRLPSLVVTLGTLYVVQGIQALTVSSTRISAHQLPADIVQLGRATFGRIPHLMWFAIAAAILATWVTRSTRFGRDLYAMGSNPPAAELVGIPVVRRTVGAFLISGLCAGMAGALFLARFAGTDANAGIGLELQVVAACVIGGVFIFGGSGSPMGALIGAVLLKVISLSLIAIQVPEFWQRALVGVLIIGAIAIDRLVQVRAERRRRTQATI